MVCFELRTFFLQTKFLKTLDFQEFVWYHTNL